MSELYYLPGVDLLVEVVTVDDLFITIHEDRSYGLKGDIMLHAIEEGLIEYIGVL